MRKSAGRFPAIEPPVTHSPTNSPEKTRSRNAVVNAAPSSSAEAAPAQSSRRVMLQVLHALPPMPTHPCAYLPGQVARDRGFAVHRLEPGAWLDLLESGWRRSGMMIYEPACPFCRACRSLRLPVAKFRPNATMRRIARRNADLAVEITPLTISDERAALFKRYVQERHDGMMSGSRREFELFLGMSPVDSCEIEYRLGGRLVAVSTVDRTPRGWSLVYCYFDPDEPRRSLGTFNILKSLELCRKHCPAGDDAHLYLGYWVAGSRTMDYKKNFRPHEAFGPDGRWHPTE